MFKTVLFIAFIFITISQSPPTGYSNTRVSKYCRRVSTVVIDNGEFNVLNSRVIINSLAICPEKNSPTVRAPLISFRLSSTRLPHFRVIQQNRIHYLVDQIFHNTWLAFDRIIDYTKNPNSTVLGYDPLLDTVNQVIMLQDGSNLSNWTSIATSTQTLPGGNVVTRYSFSLQTSRFVISLGIDVSPIEVSRLVNGTTVTTQILTPDSFKITLDLTNITNYSPNSSGLTIGGVLVVSAAARNRTNTPLGPSDPGVRPDDNVPGQQISFGIPDNDTPSMDLAFVSWKQSFLSVFNNSQTVSQVTLIASNLTSMPISANNGGVETFLGGNLYRVWFSHPGKPTSINWDPAVGGAELPTYDVQGSNASSITISLLLLVLILIQ